MAIQAVIFDMDGLLIDSENFWQDAEYEIFSALGVPLRKEDTAITLGWRCDTVVHYWFERSPWQGPSKAEVAEHIIEQVIGKIVAHGELMPGARSALHACATRKLPTGLATSSNHRMMLAVLQHFGLEDFFQARCSAEFLPFAKPHPQVYLNAAAVLGVDPQYCLALEDSVTGVIAAKAARMRCYAVPDAAHRSDRRYGIADRVLTSLTELTEEDLR